MATYAGVVLWNYRPLVADEPANNLTNLATLCTFTGSLDEQWFYLVSVAMEARGAPALPLMLDAIAAARANEPARVTHALERFAEIVSELADLLQEMYVNCSPHAFYHGFRPYLAGSRNMADAGLPRGILYEDNSGNEKYRQYGGGSNAQSSLIQFLDLVLGIEHRPTGEHAPSSSSDPNAASSSSGGLTSGDETEGGEGPRRRHNFIMDMRSYMPGPHRRFLEHVAVVANIHDFVAAHPDDAPLCMAYDAALAMVHALRQRHIQMVTRYIVVKSRESRKQQQSQQQSQQQPSASSSQPQQQQQTSSPAENNKVVNLSTARNNPKTAGKKLRGTGGTALIEFLKQARNETGEPAVGAWANRILNNASWQSAPRRPSSVSDTAQTNPNPNPNPTATAGAGAGAAPAAERVATLPTLGESADGQVEVVGLAGSWSLDQSEGGLCHW